VYVEKEGACEVGEVGGKFDSSNVFKRIDFKIADLKTVFAKLNILPY